MIIRKGWVVQFLLAMFAGGAHAAATSFSSESGALPHEQSIVFETMDGIKTDAFEGTLEVPENRNKDHSRTIQLRYVRFPATTKTPGTPIIYLAGGPGGSGIQTARYPGFRYPLFMALREHGDVIAFDQRGTGASTALPECVSGTSMSNTMSVTDADIEQLTRQSAKQCMAFWAEQNIDLSGYNTLESARDINALRQSLGADKVTLWGISYGSHLALASLKVMPGHIEKIVIASAEGLNQTVKLPSRTDRYFERLQKAINQQPEAAALYPDINGLIRRVHQSLEQSPILISVPDAAGGTSEFLFQRFHMQALAAGMIADPHRGVAALLATYRSIDAAPKAQTEAVLGNLVQRAGLADPALKFELMPLAMDVASGLTPARLKQVKQEAPGALLGSMLNFPMPQLAGQFPELDLGDDFREGPVSEVPTLLLTGTLDGRTYPEGQAEAVSGLKHLTQVTIINAGHNLFMVSPQVTEVMHQFLRDGKVSQREIEVPLPSFVYN